MWMNAKGDEQQNCFTSASLVGTNEMASPPGLHSAHARGNGKWVAKMRDFALTVCCEHCWFFTQRRSIVLQVFRIMQNLLSGPSVCHNLWLTSHNIPMGLKLYLTSHCIWSWLRHSTNGESRSVILGPPAALIISRGFNGGHIFMTGAQRAARVRSVIGLAWWVSNDAL